MILYFFIAGGLLLGLIIYTLSPTVRNVSEEAPLKPYLGRQRLQRPAVLYALPKGFYDVRSNQLAAPGSWDTFEKAQLPAGTEIFIQSFKTYRNNLGSGFTHLLALGTVFIKGNPTDFECPLGQVDRDFYKDKSWKLNRALWQD